jgi:hypothetical protein
MDLTIINVRSISTYRITRIEGGHNFDLNNCLDAYTILFVQQLVYP